MFKNLQNHNSYFHIETKKKMPLKAQTLYLLQTCYKALVCLIQNFPKPQISPLFYNKISFGNLQNCSSSYFQIQFFQIGKKKP